MSFAGKGLDITVLLRFLLNYSPKLIPLVLPLTVLLASIMTYGSLAEHYEFAALKSAGISLDTCYAKCVCSFFITARNCLLCC